LDVPKIEHTILADTKVRAFSDESGLVAIEPQEDYFDSLPKLRSQYIFSSIFASRVLEHIPQRELDYFLYLLRTMLKTGAKGIFVVPNFPRILREIEKAARRKQDFLLQRLTFELFNEGTHIFDYHKSYWDVNVTYHYFERENLFKVTWLSDQLYLDSNIVPPYIVFEVEAL
jgi:hypothetical protein